MNAAFPFSAIVGQDDIKLALLIAAVDSGIGGVLVLGDRGTGKSTAIRSLASLLPQINRVCDCHYGLDIDEVADCGCSACKDAQATDRNVVAQQVPVVTLPLGATEDRVVGALDIEHALATGQKRFQPGLLAQADRGFLYVDEVNLLDDHIVDVLLDVAASGVNRVERDGISIEHPSRFVLVGSGNPEEGDLRPQLLDRFGLSVEVVTPTDIDQRVQVVERRDQYDLDPQAFVRQWQTEDQRVQHRLLQARQSLPSVEIGRDIRARVSELCVALNTDGLRGDLTLLRAARVVAALHGDPRVEFAHVRQVASMALRHRLRRDPLDESGSSARVERALANLPDANAA
jgi:magnesium chelatase subunit I